MPRKRFGGPNTTGESILNQDPLDCEYAARARYRLASGCILYPYRAPLVATVADYRCEQLKRASSILQGSFSSVAASSQSDPSRFGPDTRLQR